MPLKLPPFECLQRRERNSVCSGSREASQVRIKAKLIASHVFIDFSRFRPFIFVEVSTIQTDSIDS